MCIHINTTLNSFSLSVDQYKVSGEADRLNSCTNTLFFFVYTKATENLVATSIINKKKCKKLSFFFRESQK